MNEPSSPKATEHANIAGVAVTLLVIVALVFLIDLDSVRSWIEGAGVWGPLVFILLKISTIVIAPLSGSPLYPLVGLFFGFWPGLLYVMIGDLIGYSIAFSISRFFGKRWVEKFISNKEESLLARIVNHVGTPRGFFHACMTLFAMPELLAYGAGLSRLSYLTFISIIAPLLFIGSSALVFFGSILDGSGHSGYLSFGIPIIGALAVLIGGFFFAKGVKKRD